MYAPASTPHSLTVFVSGQNCILPVRVTGFEIVEEVSDSNLNPIRAEVAVTLIVLNSPELSADPRAQLWQNHLARLRELAETASQSSLSQLGISELP